MPLNLPADDKGERGKNKRGRIFYYTVEIEIHRMISMNEWIKLTTNWFKVCSYIAINTVRNIYIYLTTVF